MRTPRLPVVDWTDTPANLNGIVRFAGWRNLVSARLPSHFNWPLPTVCAPCILKHENPVSIETHSFIYWRCVCLTYLTWDTLTLQHVCAFESFRCGIVCQLWLCASLSLINLAFPTASCNMFSILFIYLFSSLRLSLCFSLYPQG